MRERMMECSEARIEVVANHGDGHAARAAGRVMESAQAWQDWSASHIRLLDSIATQQRSTAQVRAVRRMALSMIHRKAPFEGLRDLRIHGDARIRFFESLYGSHNSARTLLLEHRSFLSAMCSYVCVEDLCGLGTLQRIRAYERIYTRYWQARVATSVVPGMTAGGQADPRLRDRLREHVLAARYLLLERAPGNDDELTLAELRRPTGDTVRMRRLSGGRPPAAGLAPGARPAG
jgi:hypothetical protein